MKYLYGFCLLCLVCLLDKGCTPPQPAPTTDLCTPARGGYAKHDAWRAFLQEADKTGLSNACLQMAWRDDAYQGATTTLAHLDKTTKRVSKEGLGKSPFVGLDFPANRGDYSYRFRIFVFAKQASLDKETLCKGDMSDPSYQCQEDGRCGFFLELRIPASSFRGKAVPIEGDNDLLCRAYFRAASSENGGEGGEVPDANADQAPEGSCQPGTERSCYDGPDESAGKGPCKRGTQRCSPAGSWGPCEGQVLPTPETCNLRDDNCDGQTDNAPSCAWVRQGGGRGDDIPTAIATSTKGEAIIAGYSISPNTTFGSIPGLAKRGIIDMFVAKLSPQGEWRWVQLTGGAFTQIMPWDIAIDDTGAAYVAGFFQQQVQFGTSQVFLKTTKKQNGLFVAKLDANGKWLWAKVVESDKESYGGKIIVDPKGDVYVSGLTSDNAVFGEHKVQTGIGGNAFIAALSRDGKWRWVRTMTQNKQVHQRSPLRVPQIALAPQGHIIFATYYNKDTVLGKFKPPFSAGKALVVAAINKSGEWLWINHASKKGGGGQLFAMAIAVDHTGTIAVGGHMDGTTEPHTFGKWEVDSKGFDRAYIAWLNPKGEWQGATGFGEANRNMFLTGMGYDANKNLYVCGNFSHNVSLGKTTLKAEPWLSNYFAMRAADGTWKWAIAAPGHPKAIDYFDFNFFPSISVLPSGNYYFTAGVAGDYVGSSKFTRVGGNIGAVVGHNITK